jgi:hypothetical protein
LLERKGGVDVSKAGNEEKRKKIREIYDGGEIFVAISAQQWVELSE